MKLEEIKGYVKSKCEEFDSGLFTLDKSLHGRDLRDRIFELNQYLANFNEYASKLRNLVNKQEIRVDRIESLAMQQVTSLEAFKGIPATLKKYFAETYEFDYGDEKVSITSERDRLQDLAYCLNKLEVMFNNIKNTTMACQSGLNYDKEEMKIIPIS